MALVKVQAITKVRDNGVWHSPGEDFDMDAGIVDAHVRAGQIKMLETPSDKQVKTSPVTK